MTLSDVPHKPRPRAFAPPGHGLAIFPRSLSLACLAVLRPRVPLPRYFVAAAHQSTPGPWCRGGVGLLGYLGELQNRAAVFLGESVARIPITRRHVDTGVAGDLDAVLFHRLSLSTSV